MLVQFLIPMHPDLLSAACLLYGTSPSLLIPLSGGNYNAVYRFPLPHATGSAVLRIGAEDCPVSQTLGMLEWVRFLKDEGAPVAAPIPSIHGRLVESLEQDGTRYTITVFEIASGTRAELIPPTEWTDELIRNIGRAAGVMHCISRRFEPSASDFIRPHWFDSSEVRQALTILSASSDPGCEHLTSLINELKHLPTGSGEYGMIHDDLHFANFLVTSGLQVTIVDFDDCGFGWFAMDVAMALFDVLVLYNPLNDAEAQRFARHFLSHYLNGYRLENDISPYWQAQIPRFLKLKELCIYATLIGHSEISQPETWVGRFMRGRASRVSANIPYVDIDYINI